MKRESNGSKQGYGAKQLAHQNAQKTNLEEYIAPGDMIETYIETPPENNGGQEAVARYSNKEVQDVRVFIDPGEFQLHRGNCVRCKIRYCGDSFLKALALYRLD